MSSYDHTIVRPRALITGGSGMIGHALAAELGAAGYSSVTVLTRDVADLADPAQAVAAFRAAEPAVVYHLAGRVNGIMGNLRSQGESYLHNIRINTNVVEAARLAGAVKVVAMGSAAVYSDCVPLPMREEQIWRGAPHRSEAAYAHAKRGMLAQLEAYYDQFGLDYAFCIATNMYGPHDRFDERHGHVLPSLLAKFERGVRTGEPVEIWGSGTPRRDFLFAADAARALRMVGERHTGTINLATGVSVPISEAVELLAQITGFGGQLVWDRSKPDGQMLRGYDVSRLHDLGFKPATSLTEGLRQTFIWLQNNLDKVRR